MLQYDSRTIGEIHQQGSRGIVGFTLDRLARENPKIIVAYADVGSRFGLIKPTGLDGLQVSIAEQSLIGIISGMCHEGFIPFGVAYAPFITMRAADQIRMSIGEMGLGIKLIGGSAGLVSGNLGAASIALDDVAMMRSIPNLTIISPADCLEAAKAIEAASMTDAPMYIRLTGNSLPPIYLENYEFTPGKANIVMDTGDDVVIYATGASVYNTLEAARKLKNRGIGCKVVDMHTVKPIDTEIIDRFAQIPFAVSVEEHNVIGGLGSAVAECLSECSGSQRLLRMGADDCYPAPDSYEKLLIRYNLTPDQIAAKIMEMMK